MRLLDRVNRHRISPDILAEALALHRHLLTEDRGSADVRTLRIIEMLHRREFQASDGDLVVAIELRLRAITRLIRNTSFHVNIWADAAQTAIRPELLKAAAAEPLIYDGQGEPAFDVERLARRVQEMR